MDTGFNGYLFMQSDSSQEQEQLMMESHSFDPNAQVLVEETQFSNAMGSISKKPQRGGNFTLEEDKLLVSAWLNISMDPILGTDQKKTTFWQRVKEFIQQNEPCETNRTTVSLQSRWSMIQLSTNKFCSCYVKIEALNQSGVNQEDKVRNAKTLYKETFGHEFRFDHCWALLKNQPKWYLESEKKNQAKKPRTGPASCPPTPDTINIDDNVTTDNFVELQRPPGTKFSKAQAFKRKNEEIVSREISSALDKITECKSKLVDKKLEMFEKAFYQEQEKIRIKQEKLDLEQEKLDLEQFKEDERVMLMDLKCLSEEQQEFYKYRRMEILHKRRRV